jgi:hypothetical protein
MNSHKASSSVVVVVVVVAVSFIVWLVGVESAYMHTREDVPLLWIYNKFYTQQAAAQFLLLFPVVWLTGIASACIRRGYKPVKKIKQQYKFSHSRAGQFFIALVLVLIFVSYCLVGR